MVPQDGFRQGGGQHQRGNPSRPMGQQGGNPGQQGYLAPSLQVIAQILDRDGRVMVQEAERLARSLQGVKTAQLRNFYGSLLLLEARLGRLQPAEIATELSLMRPRLSYMVNRSQGRRSESLQKVFDPLLKAAVERIAGASTREQAERIARPVFEFAEAVIAYHKESGGGQ